MEEKENIMIRQLFWHPQHAPQRTSGYFCLRMEELGNHSQSCMAGHLSWIYTIAGAASCSFAVLCFCLAFLKNCAESVECWGVQEFALACVSSLSLFLPTAAGFVEREGPLAFDAARSTPDEAASPIEFDPSLPLLLLKARSRKHHFSNCWQKYNTRY